MQTYDNSQENKNRKRTFIFGTLAAFAVAGAIGGAFVLGGRGGSAESSVDRQAAVSPTAPAEGAVDGSTSNPDGQSNPAPDGGDTQPVPTATPGPEEESDDPTVTPDPDDDGCNFCEDDGDLAPQPTSTPSCAFCPDGLDLVAETPVGPDPCPECVLDLDIALPIDVTPPIFESIDTVFCYPILQLLVEVDAPAEIWFEYGYDGVDYESNHMDATNSVNIGEDMADFGWAVYLISGYYVHAVDLSGNHAVSEYQPMPDPDLGCD